MSKTKVLIVRPTLGYGGADRVTVNLLNNYDNERFDVDLALMKAKGELKKFVSDEIQIFDLNARSLWFTVYPLIKLLKKSNYDVVLSTCGGMSIPMVIASKLSNFSGRVVVSERNTLYRTYSSKLKKTVLLGLKKILYKQADVVTVVSEGIKQEIIKEFSIEDHKIHVVNNPLIDASLFDLSNEPISEKYNNKFLVVAVGRFVKQKDYPTLLKAFSSFNNEVENAVLVILGKGPLLDEMKQLALNLGISNQVDFIGFDSNPYKYMSKCDLFVLSSLHEGMPGALIQALALGAVCISTDCPTGPNELIRNEENGFLVPVGDSVELARRMISLSTPEYDLSKIKKNAKLSISKYEIRKGVASYFKTI